MIRSISVPSVNGGFVDDGGFRSDSRGSGINSVMDSQMGGNRADSGSTGNMQLGMQQDEQVSSRFNVYPFIQLLHCSIIIHDRHIELRMILIVFHNWFRVYFCYVRTNFYILHGK